ncbi:MAG: class I SAM-dependent methyltransferase [Cyanobacteria bacterium J06581_3]
MKATTPVNNISVNSNDVTSRASQPHKQVIHIAAEKPDFEGFLDPDSFVTYEDGMHTVELPDTPEIRANQRYFDKPAWAKTYLKYCHRDNFFKERWRAAAGSWDNQIVVDVGCGPGNLYATLGGIPKLLIGVDVSKGSLKIAQKAGYTPLLADAHQIPLVSAFADLVVVNATLHHCADMAAVLIESARLVRPGGLLIVDHDPQLSAWNYKGLGLALYKIRLSIIYRFFLRKLHIPLEERIAALETEIHHRPGHGITTELFSGTLPQLGFDIDIYPHNNAIGAAALEGNWGPQPHWRYRFGQILSGINPFVSTSTLSLMCIGTKQPYLQ